MFKVAARTVLELGAELISSDIIAFYELIKNAFDARSKTGAEIDFTIILRRNVYLVLLAELTKALKEHGDPTEPELLQVHKKSIIASLDPSAHQNVVADFKKRIKGAKSLRELRRTLDQAYKDCNSIQISDLGTGMSLEELRENYLTLGTPSRKKEIDKALASKQKAPYLGEKGIGRLSVMRLGERLSVHTARESDRTLNILDVDWSSFRNLDLLIEDVHISPSKGGKKPEPGWHGTTITIKDLAEDWSEVKLQKLAEYDFARLTDPFKDPKSRPRIVLRWNGNRVSIPWLPKALRENAHANFKGDYAISDDGPVLRFKLNATNLGFAHPVEAETISIRGADLESLIVGTSGNIPLTALNSVGPFSFEALWYNRRYLAGIESVGNQRVVRELQKKWSGVLLFRDDFRVFPYGDEDDDWLGLDRKALGRSGYSLNKAQFVGHVSISRATNPGLIDQTNREGLRATPEQEVFIALLQHVVSDALWGFIREVERRYKKVDLTVDEVKSGIQSLEKRTKNALSRLRKVVPPDEKDTLAELQQAIDDFQSLASQAQKRLGEVEADSRQMIHMAGVGLMVEVVAHELARAAESALQAVEELRHDEVSPQLRGRLETLRAEMKTVSKRLKVLDALSVSGRQKAERFDLIELVRDLDESHSNQFKRHGIKLIVSAPHDTLTVKTVKGIVVQILENLITNSVYWMDVRRMSDNGYRPKIHIKITEDPPLIRYHDNGPGIAIENIEKIFRPFWSLKAKGRRRGLGLFIARDNAVQIGAQLYVDSDSRDAENRLHEFVFALPVEAQVG